MTDVLASAYAERTADSGELFNYVPTTILPSMASAVRSTPNLPNLHVCMYIRTYPGKRVHEYLGFQSVCTWFQRSGALEP